PPLGERTRLVALEVAAHGERVLCRWRGHGLKEPVAIAWADGLAQRPRLAVPAQRKSLAEGDRVAADGPDRAADGGRRAEQEVAAPPHAWARDNGPRHAVPMLRQRPAVKRIVAITDRPDVPGVPGRGGEEGILAWSGVRAGHDRPLQAVPVLDQGAEA